MRWSRKVLNCDLHLPEIINNAIETFTCISILNIYLKCSYTYINAKLWLLWRLIFKLNIKSVSPHKLGMGKYISLGCNSRFIHCCLDSRDSIINEMSVSDNKYQQLLIYWIYWYANSLIMFLVFWVKMLFLNFFNFNFYWK